MGALVIFLLIIAGVFLIGVGIYNGLVVLRNRCQNAWSARPSPTRSRPSARKKNNGSLRRPPSEEKPRLHGGLRCCRRH